jgi:hypothetical protein
VDSKQASSTLIPEQWWDPGFGVAKERFDVSAEVHLRSSLSSIHDAVVAAPFDHDAYHRGF